MIVVGEIHYEKLDSTCFNGIYKELVELVGHKNALILYHSLSGQVISFPKKILNDQYVYERIKVEYNGKNKKELAKKYGYTVNWFQKLMKKFDKAAKTIE